MLWYNDPDSVEAIRRGRMEGANNQRLMKLVRIGESVAV